MTSSGVHIVATDKKEKRKQEKRESTYGWLLAAGLGNRSARMVLIREGGYYTADVPLNVANRTLFRSRRKVSPRRQSLYFSSEYKDKKRSVLHPHPFPSYIPSSHDLSHLQDAIARCPFPTWLVALIMPSMTTHLWPSMI
jgi:hypothetical protein